MIRAIIFDMDGVLVDSNAAHFLAFQKMGSALGKPFTRELLDQTFGMHNNQIFPLWLGSHLTPERVAELALQKESLYREAATGALKEITGATNLVKAMHHLGYPLAVGSSGPRANVELAVKTLKLETYFSTLVTGDDVVHGKPAPDIFLKAARNLNISPCECLVIEDAPQGVQAALSAGMKVIAVTTSRPANALSDAHRVIQSLHEINSVLLSSIGG